MIKQMLINKYFRSLCSVQFFIHDENVIIGRAKDVIESLKSQVDDLRNPIYKTNKSELKFITAETKQLIKQINKAYFFKNDVIKLEVRPMAGFYELCDKDNLCRDLKGYYKELMEEKNENKYYKC